MIWGNLFQKGDEFVDDSNKKHKNVLNSTSEGNVHTYVWQYSIMQALVFMVCCLAELEVSFSLNLFKDGFSIGKANKVSISRVKTEEFLVLGIYIDSCYFWNLILIFSIVDLWPCSFPLMCQNTCFPMTRHQKHFSL